MRITGPVLGVLGVLYDASPGELYGLQVIRGTGLRSGTVYPILDRLEGEGYVARRWADETSQTGPRRRYYQLTPDGVAFADEQRTHYGIGGRPAWSG